LPVRCSSQSSPGFEQADVAAEAVDDEARDPRLFACRKQVQGADEMGEDAAAVDVGDQDHRHVGRFGEAHVGDVAVAQVDLGRAAGTFDQDAVELRRESCPAFHHRAHRDALVFVVVAGIQGIHRPAVDDHLGALVGGGLEQHRVEVDARREAGRQRLQGLGATDLAAVGGDRRVERHVLRFERCDTDAATLQDAAQRGDQRRLAGIRSAALHHQGPGRPRVGGAHR
jgi:hypothetical protein